MLNLKIILNTNFPVPEMRCTATPCDHALCPSTNKFVQDTALKFSVRSLLGRDQFWLLVQHKAQVLI